MSLANFAADVLRAVDGKDPAPRTAAILVCAGRSSRMGGGTSKLLLPLGGETVFSLTLRAFEAAREIDEIIVVARKEDYDAFRKIADTVGARKLKGFVAGGETRAASVRAGFSQIGDDVKYVAVHDGARCLVTPEIIGKVCRAAYRYRAATAAQSVTDTVKTVDRDGFITATVDRDTVYLATTPQVFRTELYRAAIETVKDADDLTDDNQLIERIRYPVKVIDCGSGNIKITRPEDLSRAAFLLSEREATK